MHTRHVTSRQIEKLKGNQTSWAESHQNPTYKSGGVTKLSVLQNVLCCQFALVCLSCMQLCLLSVVCLLLSELTMCLFVDIVDPLVSLLSYLLSRLTDVVSCRDTHVSQWYVCALFVLNPCCPTLAHKKSIFFMCLIFRNIFMHKYVSSVC